MCISTWKIFPTSSRTDIELPKSLDVLRLPHGDQVAQCSGLTLWNRQPTRMQCLFQQSGKGSSVNDRLCLAFDVLSEAQLCGELCKDRCEESILATLIE